MKQRCIRILMLVVCVQVMKCSRPLLRRKDTGLRHHPEDHSGITRRERKREQLLDFFSPHSSVRNSPESQQWSPDGAAKAGLIHVFLAQATGWRNEEVEGRLHQDYHHNSGVGHAVRWLMVTINPALEKRGYYIYCGGELWFALWKLKRS